MDSEFSKSDKSPSENMHFPNSAAKNPDSAELTQLYNLLMAQEARENIYRIQGYPEPPMHELFLNAEIGDDAISRSLRILQGYCSMSPVPLIRRKLLWTGPSPRTKGMEPSFIMAQGPRIPLWRTLNEQLVRQPYIVALLYEVGKEKFPKSEEEKQAIDCDQLPGTVQWTEVPDPGTRPVNSRLAVTIEGERNLCHLLQSMSFRFAGEIIEEGYRFVHENVVIYLTRFLKIPSHLQELDEGKPKVNSSLPPYEVLEPFDVENKWIMMAKVDILNGNDQEQMQKGIEELTTIKKEFEGCFDLKVNDRLIFDTRVKA